MGDIQPANENLPAKLGPNPQQLRVSGFGSSAPCPGCGSTQTAPVAFTWWGGVLGPRLFSVVRCMGCNLQYNGKKGTRLGGVIAVYTAIALVLAGALVLFVR